MKETDSKLLLDSSAWLAYLLAANKEIKEYIETETTLLLTSIISVHEVKKKLIREKCGARKIRHGLCFIKENSVIVELGEEIFEKAVEDCVKHKLHTIDALIYRTAIENKAILVTGDKDFKGLKNVKMLE